MKLLALTFFLVCFNYNILANAAVESTNSIVRLEKLPEIEDPDKNYSWVQFKFGKTNLDNLKLENNYYKFFYDCNASSNTIEFSFEKKITGTPFGEIYYNVTSGLDHYYQQIEIGLEGFSNEVDLYIIPISFGLVLERSLIEKNSLFSLFFGLGFGGKYLVQTGDIDGVFLRNGQLIYEGIAGLKHGLSWASFENTKLSISFKRTEGFESRYSVDSNSYLVGIDLKI